MLSPLRLTAMLVYWGLSLFSVKFGNSDNVYIGYFSGGLIEALAGIIGPVLLTRREQ